MMRSYVREIYAKNAKANGKRSIEQGKPDEPIYVGMKKGYEKK